MNPQNNYRIKLLEPSLDENLVHQATQYFFDNLTQPHISIQKFESALSAYTCSPYICLLNSGTSALHLALILSGVKKDDDVICPSFTFAATAFAIKYIGANPVFIDTSHHSWDMDPNLLNEAIVEGIGKGKKPKAIIVVHAYGYPANVDAIMELSRTYQIPVLEEGAGAIGSFYRQDHVGTIGDLGILSFNYNKVITTAGGGAILLKNKEDYNKIRYLASQAKDNTPYYQHQEIGYNYQMNHFAAELGNQQLTSIDDFLGRKYHIYKHYQEGLKDMDIIELPALSSDYKPNYWLNMIFFNNKEMRDHTAELLKQYGIETRPVWKPMHLQPIFNTYKSYITGASESYFDKGLCLPSSINITDDQINQIIGIIKNKRFL